MKRDLKLLIYEHAAGGGFRDKTVSSSILSEGYGMLNTLITDFKAAGHHVTTLLDSRLAAFNPSLEADCIIPISSLSEAEATLKRVSESVDAVYVIAPESNQVLETLVEGVEQTGVLSLNCSADAIGSVSDKMVLYEFLKELGLPTPETIVFNALDDAAEIKQTLKRRLGFPLIFKPVDGAGCSRLSVVRNASQVADALIKTRRESSSRQVMAQELVEGVAASVSMISAGSEALPIALNKQNVTLRTPERHSSYDGGHVPLDNPLKKDAFAAAEKTVKSFGNLRGYVGVDLILTEKEPVVIEVNPRLTTSYVGVRDVVNFSIAQSMINAVLRRELPTNVQVVGSAVYSKVQTTEPTTEALKEIYKIKEVVTPPFPVFGTGEAHALIVAHGTTLNEAMSSFHEAKECLLSITYRG